MGIKRGEFKHYLSIKPNYCADFTLYIPSPEEAFNRARPERNKSNGKMSRAARGRLMNAINWMVLFSPRKYVKRKAPKNSFYFKVNFLTVTLSDAQRDSDEYIKQHMLEPLLKWMKRSYNCINYVWRAETQENGNIHFHITTNKFIPLRSLNNKWNGLQQQHGYLKRYFNTYGHHNAPSTDIKAVKNTRELASYMGKYFAKERPEKQHTNLTSIDKFPDAKYFDICMGALAVHQGDALRRGIDGKQWACSTSLTKLSVSLSESEPDYWEDRRLWIDTYGKDMKKVDYATIYRTEWNLNSEAPIHIAEKVSELCRRFNDGDNGVLSYIDDL